MRGLSVAMAAWQIRQVLTLGRPACGPFVTASWQYSVQVRPFSMWVLCGNSIGCWGFEPTRKYSFTAPPKVSCAVVSRAFDNWPDAVYDAPLTGAGRSSSQPQ